jgi:hypothetical protein
MRHLFYACLLLMMQPAFGQKLPADGVNKIRISLPDKMIVAEIIPLTANPKAIAGLWYWWYNAGTIRSTQGGFAGKLLNGKYQEFYPDKSLREDGSFKKGLKDGCWKTWNNDGTIRESTYWHKGRQISGERTPLLKRLNIFKKKPRNGPADTIKKSG